MTRLTLAEVQALAGFTDGPWRMSIENGSGVVAGHRHAIVSAYSSPLGWPCVRIERASGPLVLAAPDLHADCLALHAAVAERDAALHQIATAIGAPAGVDPLADLPGLVLMVQGVVQRAESSAIVVVDAVAAERMAIGEWVRSLRVVHPDLDKIARGLEHGDHIGDDAPPMPSLRMTLLLRDELLWQVETLTAERDTLAARVAKLEGENVRLTSRVEIFAGALLSLGAS